MLVDRNFALKMAVRLKDMEWIKRLVVEGANLEVTTETGKTVIEAMVEAERWDMVEFIAQHQKTNSYDYMRYRNALIDAVKAKRLSTVEYLLKAETPLQLCIDSDRNYPLHIAVLNSQPEMIALLLKYGADASKMGSKWATPMELADKLERGSCWDEGWKMYYLNAFPKNLTRTLIQGHRQKDCGLSSLPVEIIELINAYLVNERDPSQKMDAVKHNLYQISARCFTEHYSSGYFHSRSDESKVLVDKIKAILKGESHEAIGDKIETFINDKLEDLPEGGYRQSRAIALLNKYKLIKNDTVVENPLNSYEFKLRRK